MRSKLPPLAAAILVAIGLSTSGYLFLRSLLLTLGTTGSVPDICSMVFRSNCDATLMSTTSEFLGLPVAGWGVVYFAGVGALLSLGYLMGPRFSNDAATGALYVATVGLGISLFLVGILLLGFAPLCPMCFVVHTCNVLLWPVLFTIVGRNPRAIVGSGIAALRFVVGLKSKYEPNPDLPWTALGFFAATLLALSTFLWVSAQNAAAIAESETNPSALAILMLYRLQPQVEIPIGPDDPRRGPDDAPVQIVVFSDFECLACRQFHENLAKVEEMYEGSVSVVYKHFPLDTKCNTRMTEALHNWACDAAALAEAARVKGKFWEAHDAMFESKYHLNESVLADIAKDLDIEWPLPAGASESDSRVQADIEAAIELGLDGTPAVFMNGRRVMQPIERALRLLLFYELTAVGQQGLDEEDAMDFDDHGILAPATPLTRL